eukprot:scaffold19677_cov17-Tisochrysis_lutea.AAC.1
MVHQSGKLCLCSASKLLEQSYNRYQTIVHNFVKSCSSKRKDCNAAEPKVKIPAYELEQFAVCNTGKR